MKPLIVYPYEAQVGDYTQLAYKGYKHINNDLVDRSSPRVKGEVLDTPIAVKGKHERRLLMTCFYLPGFHPPES
jgi:hypothetical protein